MDTIVAAFYKLVDELSVERWSAHPGYGDIGDSIIDVTTLRAAVNWHVQRLPEEYKQTITYRSQLAAIELFIEKYTQPPDPFK